MKIEEFINEINAYSAPYTKNFNKQLKENENEILPFLQTATYIVSVLETMHAVELPKLNEEKYQDKLIASIAIVFINAVVTNDENAITLKKKVEQSIGLVD